MSYRLVRRIPKEFRIQRKADADIMHKPLSLDLTDEKQEKAFHRLMMGLVVVDRRNQINCFAALQECGAMKAINAFMKNRPESSFVQDYVDLWNLWNYVHTEKPSVVWEFGSGISTAVIAHALESNRGDGRVFSLEVEQKWADSTTQSIPDALRHRCKVFHSPAEDCAIGDTSSVRYSRLPDALPDMIYIDAAHDRSVFNGAEDVFFIENELKPGTAVFIDGRCMAILFFQMQYLKRQWEMQAESVILNTVPSGKPKIPSQGYAVDKFSNVFLRLVE